MLRSARSGIELPYIAVQGAPRHGMRPPRLEKKMLYMPRRSPDDSLPLAAFASFKSMRSIRASTNPASRCGDGRRSYRLRQAHADRGFPAGHRIPTALRQHCPAKEKPPMKS
jgi:hypothetical protein